MAKPEWGQKRACPGCGSRFYDLMRDPITCPNCGTTVDPTAFSKTRRSRSVAAKPVAPAPVEVVAVAEAEAATDDDDAIEIAAVADDDDDDALIEDASELGEDENDVSDVIESVEGEGADDG